MELSRAAQERALARWPVARLATHAPGGAAHLVPVVFARTGERLWTPVDGKPKRGGELARVAHVRRDPRVGLLLDRYDDDWSLLWWLRVEGVAEVVRDERGCGLAHEIAAAAAALRAKYPQYAQGTALFAGVPTLIAITPRRTTSWAASPAAERALLEGWEHG
jgi:PPOX class probable F420-dependent enzyme